MRTAMIIVFGLLALLRIQADGSVIDQTGGKNINHPSLNAWYVKMVTLTPQATVKSAFMSADGKTVLILLESMTAPPLIK